MSMPPPGLRLNTSQKSRLPSQASRSKSWAVNSFDSSRSTQPSIKGPMTGHCAMRSAGGRGVTTLFLFSAAAVNVLEEIRERCSAGRGRLVGVAVLHLTEIRHKLIEQFLSGE